MAQHFLNTPIVYKLGTKFISYIPTAISYAFARTMADISFLFYKSAVEKFIKKLRPVFPDASDRELAGKTRKIFRNYAEYLVDYGRFSNLDNDTLLQKIVHFDGEENLTTALNMQKGIILLTAHLGNWELGGIFFGAYGLKVNVVTLPDEDTEIDSNRNRYRKNYGIKTITIGDTPFSTINLVNALGKDELVAMLIDRYSNDKDSITIDFFNRPEQFPKGPFVISRITGAPIIVAFVVKENGVYKGIIEKPFLIENRDDETASAEKVVRIFERYIVQYSEQWYDFR